MLVKRHSHTKYLLPIVLLSVLVIALLVIAVVRTNQLLETRSTLTSTQSELSDTLIELEATHTKLSTTEAELNQARANIVATQAELNQARANIVTTQNKLTNTQNELQITSGKLTATAEKLAKTEGDFAATRNELQTERLQADSLQSTLNNLQVSYDRLTAGYGYVLKDPTYQAMKSFLAADMTDTKPYDINNYVCVDFSADVKTNALKQKIRCAYISINLAGNVAHAIVAFNTIDKGLIYIEPQSDEEVNLEIGKHYYQCVIPKPGYYYEKPNYDDTIVKFLTIW